MEFPEQKGTLLSSENHTWNVADDIGKGATATVYLARHKSDGRVVAVKYFHANWRHFITGDDEREMELVKSLKHKNIITVFGVEHELLSRRPVIVMEYCEGGSLYHVLQQPQNCHGLGDDEFLQVLGDLSGGIEYLHSQDVVHRDIKPGNIMRTITDEGKSVYKLTDFGAARQMQVGEESFTSLCGTEEYLHPEVYERAVLRLPTGRKFTNKIDLWSLGATIYHVATGNVPFRPHQGRRDKTTMFRMTSQKLSGVIAGVQTSADGPISYKRDFPANCGLSTSLKEKVVPIVAGLMESDDSMIISYQQFFRSVRDIEERKTVMQVFNCQSGCIMKLYLKTTHTYTNLRESVAHQSEIQADDQLLLTGSGIRLEEVVSSDLEVGSYPTQVLHETIYLFPNWLELMQEEKPTGPTIPSVPSFPNYIDMEKDLTLSHACLSRAHLIERHVQSTVQSQLHLFKAVECLHSYIKHRMRDSGERLMAMTQTVGEFQKRIAALMTLTEIVSSLDKTVGRPTPAGVAGDVSVKNVFKCVLEREGEIIQYRDALVHRFGEHDCEDSKLCRSSCDDCLSRVKHRLQETTTIHSRFKRDKKNKDQMSEHDQSIHGYERERLRYVCVQISSILQDHCLGQRDASYSEAIKSFCFFLKQKRRIYKIEQNIESVTDCLQLLSSKVDKWDAKIRTILLTIHHALESRQSLPTDRSPDLNSLRQESLQIQQRMADEIAEEVEVFLLGDENNEFEM